MFKKLRQFYKEFDDEILKKDEKEIEEKNKKADAEVKKKYEKETFDFKGNK